MGIIGDYFDKAQYDPPTLIRALEIIERTKMSGEFLSSFFFSFLSIFPPFYSDF